MMDWVYSEKVKDHFMNPRNVLESEDSFPFNGKGIVGDMKCGDEMAFYILVDKDAEVITDCRWKTYGCASAIASTSFLSEKIIGMTLEKAFTVSPKEIMKDLDGLPDHKVHCSVLGDKALRAAINNYYETNGMPEKVKREEAKVICHCMNITDHEIEEAVLDGAKTYLELQEKTKIGTVCGKCQDEASTLLAKYCKTHFDK
jgi:nitrogen fixation protein NifU and related proteins